MQCLASTVNVIKRKIYVLLLDYRSFSPPSVVRHLSLCFHSLFLLSLPVNKYIFMSTYKLYYFDGRGRSEVSRLIFAAAGQKFEDIRYSESEWALHKSEMPLGQMPVLEIDGFKLPQSMTIARFLARQFHLAGKDNIEQGKTEAVADTAADLLNKFGPIVWYEKGDEKKASLEKFFANELPKHLRNLETLGKSYGEGGSFFVGGQLTFADLQVYDVLENILEVNENVLNEYSWLKNNREEVAKNPNIAAYLKNRPRTEF